MKVKVRPRDNGVISYLKDLNKSGVSRISGAVIAVMSSRASESNKEGLFFRLKDDLDIKKIKDIELGAQIIGDALLSGENIVAMCDYDSDGCHSAAVIHRSIKEMGFSKQLKVMTPDRMKDGYGANPRLVHLANDFGAKVIITADNGISAFAAVDTAKELGIKFVITDHHLVPEKGMPNADAVIDPARSDCGWENGVVCGATVAFFTMICVRDYLKSKGKDVGMDINRMFQLVAAATIADCVPMVGINRAIVKYGMKQLADYPYIGYKALLEVYKVEKLTTETIGFIVGPAINSAGRLGSAAPAITFLVTDQEMEANAFARMLSSSNDERKEIQADIVESVLAEVDERLSNNNNEPFLVFGDPKWHHGVVGIVSSKVSEREVKPSIVFGGADDSGVLKGSGRSGETGLHMKDFFDRVAFEHPDLFLGYGGHAAAAGCSIMAKDFLLFKEVSSRIGEDIMSKMGDPVLYVDGKFDSGKLKTKDIDNIYLTLDAGPFGQKFPSPEFIMLNVKTEYAKPLGKSGDHFSVVIGGIKTVAFNMMDDMKDAGESMDVIVSPSFNTWQGVESRQFIIQRILKEGQLS